MSALSSQTVQNYVIHTYPQFPISVPSTLGLTRLDLRITFVMQQICI